MFTDVYKAFNIKLDFQIIWFANPSIAKFFFWYKFASHKGVSLFNRKTICQFKLIPDITDLVDPLLNISSSPAKYQSHGRLNEISRFFISCLSDIRDKIYSDQVVYAAFYGRAFLSCSSEPIWLKIRKYTEALIFSGSLNSRIEVPHALPASLHHTSKTHASQFELRIVSQQRKKYCALVYLI